ncbi:MAG TPA: hypothetical protein VNJ28_04430, partial [Candidatus Limnocylindrales bacterium]|nr:hypothetical protein [Candidatus Limnocylindrales bacterium]
MGGWRDDEDGGRDVGRDLARDLGGEPPPAIRDAPPDVLAPIDPHAPVSGHVPAREPATPIAASPEHDWAAARGRVFPLLRPAGTPGFAAGGLGREALLAEAVRGHAQPIVDPGPCDLVVVYALAAEGFDVLVNADHLLAWGVDLAEVRNAALANLAAWSTKADWTTETGQGRRLVSSTTGEGWDAARILLPEVLERLATELGREGRVVVGVPERH